VIVVGFIFLRWIPALLFLPYWFIIQLAYGIGSLFTASSGGGVAFWAHVGGFVSGLILVLIFRKKKQKVMTVEDEWDKYLYGR
jgi:membrane associated rhomboid family serine protease